MNKKSGCDFGCDFCPLLSTFVHSYKRQRPPKSEAFVLKILKLALYARRDSNPQPLAPEANALKTFHHEFRKGPCIKPKIFAIFSWLVRLGGNLSSSQFLIESCETFNTLANSLCDNCFSRRDFLRICPKEVTSRGGFLAIQKLILKNLRWLQFGTAWVSNHCC